MLKVLEQLAEFLVEREVAVLKVSSTWVSSSALSLAHCEILGNCLGLSAAAVLGKMEIKILAPQGGCECTEPCVQVK